MEWVEVRGKSVEVAVAAALTELGLENREQAEVEILQEPEKGFLGIGGKDAVVRVKPRGERKRRRRRRRGGSKDDRQGQDRPQGGDGRSGGRSRNEDGKGASNGKKRQGDPRQQRPKAEKPSGRSSQRQESGGRERPARPEKKEAPTMPIEEQAPIVEEFLSGLVDSFGLDGDVSVRIDDEVLVADVSGPQTEAMVGARGSVIEAIHELTKTVLQRQTQASARLRLDIAGYGERRRQALAIYAGQLIDQVVEEGGEVMLEPMPAGDRKVIHDAVAAREGVQSYSEGEAPRRYVVIASTRAGSTLEEE